MNAAPAMLSGLTPMLRSWDLPGSIAFYTGTLGFALQGGGADDGWASLACDGVEIMLAAPNAHEGDAAPAFTGSLYLRTGDVDAWWRRLKDAARVCYPVEDFDYGMREFAVYDNNGYLLQFGQPLCAAAPDEAAR
ncbi:bleomycin resistance protein [Luteimonas aquatica]|uniref:bleomycin resistance protein n=1 Tax=Luteimonas aquatica TaxID=450364 RepID=UPI001F57BCB9|nr:VOC family protein [Luteimonas aquatica]